MECLFHGNREGRRGRRNGNPFLRWLPATRWPRTGTAWWDWEAQSCEAHQGSSSSPSRGPGSNRYVWSNHLRLCSWPASSSRLLSVVRGHLPRQRADGTQLNLLWGPFSIRGHSPTSLPTPACPGPQLSCPSCSHAHSHAPPPPSQHGLKPARCWHVVVCAATGNPIILEELP